MTESTLRKAVRTFDLREHSERLDDRERDASYGLLVMVVGAGNFGKSSLVNSLCGEPVAPVSILPKTFKIDVFTHGKPGTALVRRVGEPAPTECSSEAARRIEADDEVGKRPRGKMPLAEIVWHHDGLSLPRGISVVDTPGISQALRGAAKGISLTKVLGSTFEVDEVWARWFHRADVVMWAFCANKMEDADTRLALESALDLFDKPILPIATKADLIPQERWREIEQRFETVYGPLLKGRRAGQLLLTVTGGTKPALVGSGIPELRATLADIATAAETMKSLADSAFVRDESKAVAQVLDETAKVMVSNLRAIASLGDMLAVEAVREAERGRKEAVVRVGSYLRTLRSDPRLEEVAQSVHKATNGGRSGDIEAEARLRLTELIDAGRIEASVNSAFAGSARSLEAMGKRLAEGTDVARLNFRSSGKITRVPVPLWLNLEAFSVTSSLVFSVHLDFPSGFFATAWDRVKGVLGMERFSLAHIRAAISDALELPEDSLSASMLQALYGGLAPALKSAVESALKEHLKAMDSRALQLLREVDVFLPELDPPGASERATTYGSQAEYWASLDPAVEALLGLAREELTRLLPEFESVLVQPFRFEKPGKVLPFMEVWRGRILRRKEVVIKVGMRQVMAQSKCVKPLEPDGPLRLRFVPFLPKLIESHAAFLEASPLIVGLDERLATAVVGARYEAAGAQMVQIGSKAFQSAQERSSRTWSTSMPHDRLMRLSFLKGTFIGSALSAVLGIVFLLTRVPFALFFLFLAVGWFGYGFFRAFVELYLRYRHGIGAALAEEVRECQRDSVALLPSDLVDRIVNGMSAELAPRPLQQLLYEAGLMAD